MKIRTSHGVRIFHIPICEAHMEKNITLLDGERIDKINEKLSLIQKKDGLTFGTDAYLLAAFVTQKGKIGADLGAGTGVASLLCAARGKSSKIYSVEVQSDFAELCRRNAELNGLSEVLVPVMKDVRELSSNDTDGEVDFVISNPPYMAKDSGKGNDVSAKNIARREVLGGIGDFCAAASRILKYGGDFYTVYRPERMCDLICGLRENSLEPKLLVTVYPRKDSAPCLVLVKSKKGGRSGLTVAPPLVIYRDEGTDADFPIPEGEKDLGYTAEFAKIYSDFSLEHLFER